MFNLPQLPGFELAWQEMGNPFQPMWYIRDPHKSSRYYGWDGEQLWVLDDVFTSTEWRRVEFEHSNAAIVIPYDPTNWTTETLP